METDAVWRALTSPHRRRILDLLRDGPLTTGQTAKKMPGLSRFAVMQHLKVLEEAGLVVVRREGRERFNFANPMPLREIYERWVSQHSSAAAETAQHLKRYAETTSQVKETMNESDFRAIKVEIEAVIKASPEKVFQAITRDLNKWWPHRFKPGSTVTNDSKVGGFISETWEGGGAVYAVISYFEEGKVCKSTNNGLFGSFSGSNKETVEEHPDGTLYKKSLALWGDVPEEMERMYREGANMLVQKALREYMEQGIQYSG